MKQFRKIIIISIALFSMLSCNNEINYTYTHETDKAFPVLEVEGTYYEIGYAVGSMFKNQIFSMLKNRKNWFDGLREVAGEGEGSLYEQLFDKAMQYYPQYIEELEGMAEGSGVPFRDIFILNIKAELGAEPFLEKEEVPGCSSIYFIRSDGKFLMHNEDGHRAFTGGMFIVKATPPSGVKFIALSYPGIMIGNGPGFNSFGIVQTTNYIAAAKWEIGIPRYFLNRAVLETKTIDEAIAVVSHEDRAFAYHHNLGDFNADYLVSVEVTPYIIQQFEPKEHYYHTNHFVLSETVDFPQEMNYVNNSSISRYEVLYEKFHYLDGDNATFKDVLPFLASHNNPPFSPCRHPQDTIQGTTLATAVFDMRRDAMMIFKGNLCESFPSGIMTEYKLSDFDEPLVK